MNDITYYVLFDDEGNQICSNNTKDEGFYEAPAGFNPEKNECKLTKNGIILVDLMTQEEYERDIQEKIKAGK